MSHDADGAWHKCWRGLKKREVDGVKGVELHHPSVSGFMNFDGGSEAPIWWESTRFLCCRK